MPGQKIVELSATPIPVHHIKELGKVAFGDNIGNQSTEWLVQARTDGGLEGVTIANRFMQQFNGFESSIGTVRGLVPLLREVFLGRRVDELLEVSEGRVVGVREAHKKTFWAHGWMSILAFDLLGQEMGVSCIELLGGQVRDRVRAYDTTFFYQDILNPDGRRTGGRGGELFPQTRIHGVQAQSRQAGPLVCSAGRFGA